jgi:hypothetical protein
MSPFVTLDGAGWVVPRADNMNMSGQNGGGGGTNGFFNGNGTNNMIFNQFKNAAARSVRTSAMILATFNTIAAFATAMGILYDSYSRARRNNRNMKFRYA